MQATSESLVNVELFMYGTSPNFHIGHCLTRHWLDDLLNETGCQREWLIQVPKTPSAFHPHAQRSAFRCRNARPQSRLFARRGQSKTEKSAQPRHGNGLAPHMTTSSAPREGELLYAVSRVTCYFHPRPRPGEPGRESHRFRRLLCACSHRIDPRALPPRLR